MSRHRCRIIRLDPTEPDAKVLGRTRWRTPPGSEPLGYIQRGDDQGRLLRLASGALVIQLPSGAIGTLDQRKARAMLHAENSQPF